jgi:serine/threonine-protein kinase
MDCASAASANRESLFGIRASKVRNNFATWRRLPRSFAERVEFKIREFTKVETQVPSSMSSGTLVATNSKYTPLAELGRGGMATAYLAAVQGPGGFNKLVVIKRLRPALAAEPDFLRMFLEEARLSARIDHPNVVHTTEVGFDGQHHYIAMEYLDGQSHESVLRRLARVKGADAASESGAPPVTGEEHLPLKFHLFVISQMLNGLDFAHELRDFDGNPLNVVHRDVSPHNVMVTYEGHVKLLDFGIAKAADSSGDTRTGMMKGKCAYMAAEQFGGKGLDRRADVFAVGIILWQALAGRKLWKGLSDAEIFQRVATGDIPKPSSVKPSVPPELDAICMKALALQPSDRYATAAEFQTAIDDYVSAHPELRANARELGKFVGELFAADRAKLKAIIEQQMGAGGKVSQRNLAIPVFTTKTTGSSADIAMVAASTNPAIEDTAAPRRSKRLVVLTAVALAALAVPATIFGMRAKSQPTMTSLPTNEMTTVTVRATPAEAKIFFDDAALDGNPATSSFKRDAVKHRVRAEAPGFSPKSEWVTFEARTMTMELILDPDPEPVAASKDNAANAEKHAKKPPTLAWSPPPPRTTATAAAPTAPPAVASAPPQAPPAPTPPTPPTPTAKPTGPDLDKTDPWAKKSPR